MFNSDVCLTASICLETLVIDSDPGPVPGGSCCQCQLKFQVYKLSLPCVADQLVDVLLVSCPCIPRHSATELVSVAHTCRTGS